MKFSISFGALMLLAGQKPVKNLLQLSQRFPLHPLLQVTMGVMGTPIVTCSKRISVVRLGGVVVRASDLRSRDCGFEYQLTGWG